MDCACYLNRLRQSNGTVFDGLQVEIEAVMHRESNRQVISPAAPATGIRIRQSNVMPLSRERPDHTRFRTGLASSNDAEAPLVGFSGLLDRISPTAQCPNQVRTCRGDWEEGNKHKQ